MAKKLIDSFAPSSHPISLPEDLDEAFDSLPGIGIVSGQREGEESSLTLVEPPYLNVTLPRNVTNQMLKDVFEGTGVKAMTAHGGHVGRSSVMLFREGHPALPIMVDAPFLVNERDWWMAVLRGLRKLALPEFQTIGPFDIYFLWVTSETHGNAEAVYLIAKDQVSNVGVSLGFDIVGGHLLSLKFTCENFSGLPGGIENHVRLIRRQQHAVAHETYPDRSFDDVVDMVMQILDRLDEIYWSREDVRVALMKAFHRCVQFKG